MLKKYSIYLFLPILIILLFLINVKYKLLDKLTSPNKEFVLNSEVNPSITKPSLTLSPRPTEIHGQIILNETGDPKSSKSDTWWLNSGGRLLIDGPVMKTIQGDLQTGDPWRIAFDRSNPDETDKGVHPQNIFRLVTKKLYKNTTQAIYFKINRYILSEDSRRSASNGVLFFHHYQDGNNLYYAGLRVDGYGVIKKKINGQYFTMAYKPVFLKTKYNRDSNPNLLPIGNWIGIKTEITNIDKNTILIKLYVDKNNTGGWQLVAETKDDGSLYGGSAITDGGHAGIRSDFMDVEFKNYEVQ